MRSDLFLVLYHHFKALTFTEAIILILLISRGWQINRPLTDTILTRRVIPYTFDPVSGLAAGYSRVRRTSWYCKRALQSKSREDKGKGGELHVEA